MILDRIRHWARVQPDATAIIWNEVSLSYQRFCEAISATRQYMASHDLPERGTAIVLIPELLDAWLSILALRSLGLDTVAADSADMAAGLDVRDAACLVIGDDQDCEAQAIVTHFGNNRLIRVPKHPRGNIGSGLGLEASPMLGRHILCTSGTTGYRKKVALDNATEEERNISWSRAFGYERNTVFFGAHYPLFTGVGYLKPSAVWYEGGKVVLDQRQNLFGNLFAHPITSTVVVPSLMRALLGSVADRTSPKWEFELLVAGGFLPLEVAEAAARKLTRRIGVYYASTEIATITLRSHFTSADDLIWFEPTGARQIQIVNENGQDCPVGQEGELRIRTTPLDTQSYLDDSEASAKVFRDGFFYPGDMAVRREDGRIRVLGRTADVLNVQGFKVAVAPIEQEIQALLQVDEVCVFSGVDASGNEEVAIAIRSERGISKAKLRTVAAKFSFFPKIRFKVLDDFPRYETGLRKTQRRLLRQMLFPS